MSSKSEQSGGRCVAPGWKGAVAVLALSAVCLVAFYSATWRTGDEARYFVPGRALERGQGYVQAHLPSNPPETLTPPAYPVLLAGVLKLTGESVPAAKAFTGFLYFLCVAMGLWLLRSLRLSSPGVVYGAVLVGMMALGPLMASCFLMADAPYILFSFTALVLAIRAKRESAGGWLVTCGLLAALAYLTRAVGLALIAGVVLHLLLQRRWRHLVWFGVGVGVLVAPWWIHNTLVVGSPDAYMAYSSKFAGGEGGMHYPWARLLADIPGSFSAYFFSALPGTLFAHLFDGRHLLGLLHLSFLALPLRLLIAGLIAAGFVKRCRNVSPLETYWMAYWLLLAAYPLPGIFPYYLFPLLLPAALYLMEGLAWAGHGLAHLRLPGGGRAWAGMVATACAIYVLAIALVSGFVHVRKERPRRAYGPWAPERYLLFDDPYMDSWARFVEAAEWVKSHSPAGTRIVSRKPDHVYVFSDRQGWRYDMPEEVGADDAWLAIVKMTAEAPCVLLEDAFGRSEEPTAYGATARAVLLPLLEQHRDELNLLYTTEAPETRVWQVDLKASDQAQPTGMRHFKPETVATR